MILEKQDRQQIVLLTFSRDAASTGSKAACSSQSQSSRSSMFSKEAYGRTPICFNRPSWAMLELRWGTRLDCSTGSGLETVSGSLDSWGMASSVFLSANKSRGILAVDGNRRCGGWAMEGYGREAGGCSCRRPKCSGGFVGSWFLEDSRDSAASAPPLLAVRFASRCRCRSFRVSWGRELTRGSRRGHIS